MRKIIIVLSSLLSYITHVTKSFKVFTYELHCKLLALSSLLAFIICVKRNVMILTYKLLCESVCMVHLIVSIHMPKKLSYCDCWIFETVQLEVFRNTCSCFLLTIRFYCFLSMHCPFEIQPLTFSACTVHLKYSH